VFVRLLDVHVAVAGAMGEQARASVVAGTCDPSPHRCPLALRERGSTRQRRFDVATISHEPLTADKRRPSSIAVFHITQMWAALTIVVMWLAVLFAAVYGPDIVSTGVAGDSTTVPSGVAVALFAFLATWPVAKYGFVQDDDRRR
jgi:hypothetical protein